MSDKPENLEVFVVDIKELPVEVEKDAFIPEWFQHEFAGLIHEILKTRILDMRLWHQVVGDEKEVQPEEENPDEYINWSKVAEINHFTVSGNIKYEDRNKISIQIYISRGDSIKFSSNYTYEIDNAIDNINKILCQIKDFILLSCGKEENEEITINPEHYYPEIVSILESHKEDQTPEKLFITGLFYAKAGNEEKALENLDKVIACPTNPDMVQECYKAVLTVKTRKNMKDLENANNEVYQGDPNKAIPLIENLIQITPDYMHLHFLLGVAYKRVGQREKAIEAFKKAVKIDPDHVPVIRELAEAQVAVGDLVEAEEMYRKIIQFNQANAADYYNLGMCLKRMGKTDEIDFIMEKIKELDVDGRLDSYLFSLFEVSPDHFTVGRTAKKVSIFSRLFGKK